MMATFAFDELKWTQMKMLSTKLWTSETEIIMEKYQKLEPEKGQWL